MIPLLGFTPDADPTQQGVMVNCVNLIPTERGMTGAPSPVAPAGVSALDSACRGAAAIVQLSGARRVFAGTQTKLYELSGPSWLDVSKSGDYTGGEETRWIFTQFGDATIATDGAEILQASTSGAFDDIADSPIAKTVVAVPDFVLAFNTNESTYSSSPDRWWCSAFRDHTDWTPDVSTQCTTGRLVDGAGEITAAARLGSQVAVFKLNAMYIGTYAGPPVVWQFDRIPGDIGCVGPEAVCDIGNGAIAWASDDNFYIHDGARPTAIGTKKIRQWFYDNSSPGYRHKTQACFDKQNNRVWFMFPGQSSTGLCDRALVFHTTSGQWGVSDRTVEAVLQYAVPGLTYDTLGTVYSTWDDLPDIPYDSQFWLGGGRVFSIFDSTHQLVNMVGTSTTSGFTTGDYGDDSVVSFVNKVRLRFTIKPTSAAIVGSTRPGAGDTYINGSTGVLSDSSAFDVRQCGRWHRFTFTFSGGVELNGIDFTSTKAGMR